MKGGTLRFLILPLLLVLAFAFAPRQGFSTTPLALWGSDICGQQGQDVPGAPAHELCGVCLLAGVAMLPTFSQPVCDRTVALAVDALPPRRIHAIAFRHPARFARAPPVV